MKEKKLSRSMLAKKIRESIASGLSSDGFEAWCKDQSLSDAEHAWARENWSGAVRNYGRCLEALQSVSFKKLPTGLTRDLLILGIYQILYSDVESALLVSETVEEVKKKLGKPASSFANGALRKISEKKEDWKNLQVPSEQALDSEWANWASVSLDYFTVLKKNLDFEEQQYFLEKSLDRPSFFVRSFQNGELPEFLEKTEVENCYLVKNLKKSIELCQKTNSFYMQDISSQRVLQKVKNTFSDSDSGSKKALDVCASPGGKTLGLASLGFQVDSYEIDSDRREKLKKNVQHYSQFHSQVSVLDSLDANKKYDLVWIDAPCSSSGLIQKHPDLRWKKNLNPDLLETQKTLLLEKAEHVSEDGVLVYSVCSVFLEEGKLQVQDFLSKHTNFKLMDEERLGLDPERYGDGFYVAFLTKENSAL